MGKGSSRRVVARTPNQKLFLQSVNEKDIVFVDGVYGSGKSFLATGLACEYFERKKVDKIVFARSSKHLIKEFGFSPGTWEEKSRAMFAQAVEYCKEFFGRLDFEELWKKDVIRFTSASILRGRSFSRTFIIADEMQEASREDWVLMLSRLDKESKFLALGDREQNGGNNGFFGRLFDQIEHDAVAKVRLGPEDIQRNKHIYEVCTKINQIR